MNLCLTAKKDIFKVHFPYLNNDIQAPLGKEAHDFSRG
jgi:hypothetical protein